MSNSKKTELFSNAWQWTSGEIESFGNPFAFIHLSSSIMVIASHSNFDKAMSSASVVDTKICIYNLMDQIIGKPVYRMM